MLFNPRNVPKGLRLEQKTQGSVEVLFGIKIRCLIMHHVYTVCHHLPLYMQQQQSPHGGFGFNLMLNIC